MGGVIRIRIILRQALTVEWMADSGAAILSAERRDSECEKDANLHTMTGWAALFEVLGVAEIRVGAMRCNALQCAAMGGRQGMQWGKGRLCGCARVQCIMGPISRCVAGRRSFGAKRRQYEIAFHASLFGPAKRHLLYISMAMSEINLVFNSFRSFQSHFYHSATISPHEPR